MNKYANFYIETTLSQLDAQYKIVNEQLEEIYKKYSKDHDILIQELSKIMMDFNIKGEFMDLDNKTQVKINKDMQGKIKNMIDNEKSGETESIDNILRGAAANTYNYQDYVLSLGLDFTSLPLTEKQITKIVNNKIAGKRWSDRLWDNKSGLEVQLKKDIDDFVKGKLSVNKIGSNIKNNFNASRYNSQRLARTELCRVQQEILNKFDEEHDVEWQLFMSSLDSRTSNTCREKDGQQYKITDNSRPIPPLHPHCRSVMVGIPHKDYKPSSRRDNESGDIIDYKDYNSWLKGDNKSYVPPKIEEDIKPKAPPKNTFKKATSIKEANAFANSLGIPNASYKGLDLEIANAWNEGLEYNLKKYPELKSNMKFVGSCQERNKLYKEITARNSLPLYRQMYSNMSDDELLKMAIKRVKAPKVSTHTLAQSWKQSDVGGITFNNKMKLQHLIDSMPKGVASKFHPIGGDTIKSILDHEMAHELDSLLGVSNNKDIIDLWRSLSKEEITEGLSRYAWDNSNRTPINEFIAEGWSEYLNNPTPRPIATTIGKTIEEMYKKWKK